jgi:hypothetical protein
MYPVMNTQILQEEDLIIMIVVDRQGTIKGVFGSLPRTVIA